MNRLQNLFARKHNDILSVYFSAGYPSIESTSEIINTLDSNGIDMIEVGAPFSDPMADGPIIQNSSAKALNAGMTLSKLFDQIEKARQKSPSIPLVLMGYLNPMMQFGFENLFKRSQQVGIDALIIPDLPMEEYLAEVHHLSKAYDIPVIMLITPETSSQRIEQVDQVANGFIYMVSSASTTGTRSDGFTDDQIAYFRRIKQMNLETNFS